VAFWRNGGTPLGQIRGGLDAILKNEHGVPFVLVAECGGTVCGTALVIEDDLTERPSLTPWLAAVWVDEAMRRQGIAAALLDEGVRRAGALGIERLYLNSLPALQPFYVKLGWRVVEEGVGAHPLTVYERLTAE
jgi:predicted N-acetyltransferase YhbS